MGLGGKDQARSELCFLRGEGSFIRAKCCPLYAPRAVLAPGLCLHSGPLWSESCSARPTGLGAPGRGRKSSAVCLWWEEVSGTSRSSFIRRHGVVLGYLQHTAGLGPSRLLKAAGTVLHLAFLQKEGSGNVDDHPRLCAWPTGVRESSPLCPRPVLVSVPLSCLSK